MSEILQRGIAAQYDRNAERYDRAARANLLAGRRLAAAIPDGRYETLLDVGCGTGFATLALMERFPVRAVTGVDVSAEMVERFREKLGARPDVQTTLLVSDVREMPVADASADLAICSMVLHWLADRGGAIAAIARALRPGGVMALAAPGPDHDREYVEVLRAVRPPVPAPMVDVFDRAQVFPEEVERHLAAAGMDVLDVWVEERRRLVPPDAYLERITAVGSHVWSHLPPHEQEATLRRVRAGLARAAGPRGFRYTFTKTLAIARRAG